MTTRTGLDQTLCEIFSDIFGVPPESFGRETSPDTLLEWDSLAHVRLMAAIEERFDLVITPEDQVDMLNFELIGDVLEGLIQAKG